MGCYSDLYGYRVADAYRYATGNPNGDAFPYVLFTHPNAPTDDHSDADATADAHSNEHANARADAHSNEHANARADADAGSYTYTDLTCDDL